VPASKVNFKKMAQGPSKTATIRALAHNPKAQGASHPTHSANRSNAEAAYGDRERGQDANVTSSQAQMAQAASAYGDPAAYSSHEGSSVERKSQGGAAAKRVLTEPERRSREPAPRDHSQNSQGPSESVHH